MKTMVAVPVSQLGMSPDTRVQDAPVDIGL